MANEPPFATNPQMHLLLENIYQLAQLAKQSSIRVGSDLQDKPLDKDERSALKALMFELHDLGTRLDVEALTIIASYNERALQQLGQATRQAKAHVESTQEIKDCLNVLRRILVLAGVALAGGTPVAMLEAAGDLLKAASA
jgi:hypothetical protein